jgi:hypothetical protein
MADRNDNAKDTQSHEQPVGEKTQLGDGKTNVMANARDFFTEETLTDMPVNFRANKTQVDRQANAPHDLATATKIYAARTQVIQHLDGLESRNSESEESQIDAPPSVNALRPNRLRSALVLLLLASSAVWTLLNFGLLSQQQSEREWRFSTSKNTAGFHKVSSVRGTAAERLRVGDELVSYNGKPFDHEEFLKATLNFKPGDRYMLEVWRDGAPVTVEMVAQPLDLFALLQLYLLGLVFPATMLVIVSMLFLLKPNDKAVILITIFFALLSVAISTLGATRAVDLPQLLYVFITGFYSISLCAVAVNLHALLFFPVPLLSPSRRRSALEVLLYLPCLLFILIPSVIYFFFNASRPLLLTWSTTMGLYLLAGFAVLTLSYFRAQLTDKRRIRLIALATAIVCIANMTDLAVLRPLNLSGDWQFLLARLTTIVMPFVIAYAVVRHKVIPVSFVIRRGLQYLLAKNALRLLLVLPILGIIWNILANPSRPLDEILLRNSTGFYILLALAIALLLLVRFGLREWIDRKFFREQYDQEKVLRELTDAVKESDTLSKLSRLVSSKIEAALHPTSVYLFFRDDAQNSDFSLGHSSTANGRDSTESSANLKLAAEATILRFMQRARMAIEFPGKETDDLPDGERRWLRAINANLLVPMHGTDGKLAGFFSLGEKLSEIPYTSRDKELLETLANQIALVHENLSLKDRVRREQKIKTEILSRFDEGQINLLKECPVCGRCFDRDAIRCSDDRAELTFTLPVERTIERRYRLEKLLGRGGMGAVYEATDTRINRSVALKILSGASFGNRDALRRFEREAQTAGRLQHRNIVTVFDYGTLSTEGSFLVMELVRGDSLKRILEREGKLARQTVLEWFSQILDGVEAAHKAGIVHRDLKPDNVLVSARDAGETRLCILDFGLARLREPDVASTSSVTVPGTIMGTFGYMSPEQLRGERANEQSDLFAVGVMIYESLHGERPFRATSYQEALRTVAMSSDLVFETDEEATFFRRCLAPEANARFASAGEMKRALSDLISGRNA